MLFRSDINIQTTLPAATGSGLELLTKEGKWIALDEGPNSIVVNVGDMLQMFTQHLASIGKLPKEKVLRSTTHRVVATGDERFSMPFFFHPRSEVNLGPMTAGEYLMQRLREIGLA